MGASDNLMAGVAGVANAGTDIFGKLIDYKLRQRAKQQDYLDEFNAYQQKLPLEEASAIRREQAKPQSTYVINPVSGTTLAPGQKPFAPPVIQQFQVTDPATGLPMAGTSPTPIRPVVLPKETPSPEDKINAAAQAKLKAKLPKATAGLNSFTQSIDDEIASAKDLLNDPALDKITGITGMFPNIRGGAAANAKAKLDQIGSQAFMSGFQAMKQSSPNGSTGLGAASDIEGAKVEKSRVNTDQKQSADAVRGQLKKYIATLENTKTNLQGAYKDEFGDLIEKPTGGNKKSLNDIFGK